jgi:hypothetical protein
MDRITWHRAAPGIYRSADGTLKIERSASGLWDLTDGAAWVGDAATYGDAKDNAEQYVSARG